MQKAVDNNLSEESIECLTGDRSNYSVKFSTPHPTLVWHNPPTPPLHNPPHPTPVWPTSPYPCIAHPTLPLYDPPHPNMTHPTSAWPTPPLHDSPHPTPPLHDPPHLHPTHPTPGTFLGIISLDFMGSFTISPFR